MNRHRRRAYSLVQLIALLPMIGAVSTASWMLVNRVIRIEGREHQRTNTDTVIRNVVYRIQTDARQAAAARIGPTLRNRVNDSRSKAAPPLAASQGEHARDSRNDPDSQDIGDVLTLDSPQQQVVYRSLEEKITRTCSTTGAAPVIYEWKLPKTRVKFRLETIGGSPGIVWTTVVHEVKPEAGPTRFWQSSAAAPVGQGGTP